MATPRPMVKSKAEAKVEAAAIQRRMLRLRAPHMRPVGVGEVEGSGEGRGSGEGITAKSNSALADGNAEADVAARTEADGGTQAEVNVAVYRCASGPRSPNEASTVESLRLPRDATRNSAEPLSVAIAEPPRLLPSDASVNMPLVCQVISFRPERRCCRVTRASTCQRALSCLPRKEVISPRPSVMMPLSIEPSAE